MDSLVESVENVCFHLLVGFNENFESLQNTFYYSIRKIYIAKIELKK